jgi:hypothetical protein
MDPGPLVVEEIEAGARFVHEFDRYEPVKAAFWLKASDDDHRYLYIASEKIDDTNFDVAYSEVLRLATRLGPPTIDPFRVKLINSADPLAMAAAEVHSRFPGRSATRFGGSAFGGVSVDDVYIYPSTLPAPSAGPAVSSH